MAPTVQMDQCPACSSSSRAKTDGPSKRGKHSQSTKPARLTSVAERQSDSKAYSAIGTLLMFSLLYTIIPDIKLFYRGYYLTFTHKAGVQRAAALCWGRGGVPRIFLLPLFASAEGEQRKEELDPC